MPVFLFAIQIKRLVSVVLPEADVRPAAASNASAGGFVQLAVSAPAQDSSLERIAELEAQVEALQAENANLKVSAKYVAFTGCTRNLVN